MRSPLPATGTISGRRLAICLCSCCCCSTSECIKIEFPKQPIEFMSNKLFILDANWSLGERASSAGGDRAPRDLRPGTSLSPSVGSGMWRLLVLLCFTILIRGLRPAHVAHSLRFIIKAHINPCLGTTTTIGHGDTLSEMLIQCYRPVVCVIRGFGGHRKHRCECAKWNIQDRC